MPMNAPKWIDVGGIRTRYFEAGRGEPILLLMGCHFGSAEYACVAQAWQHNFDELAKGHRVIALDKLGQGFTDNPKNDDYTMQAVVDHGAAFMAALGLAGVHLVGHSRGAFQATRLTLEYPERVRSCTIVTSSTLAPGVGTNEVVLTGCPHPRGSRESQAWNDRAYSYSDAHVTDDYVALGHEVMNLPKYKEAVRKMEDEGLKLKLFLPALAKMKQETLGWIADRGMKRPTQVIWACNDKTATLQRGHALFQLIAARERRAYFHAINRSGHFVFREQQKQFNEIVTGFLRSLSEQPVKA